MRNADVPNVDQQRRAESWAAASSKPTDASTKTRTATAAAAAARSTSTCCTTSPAAAQEREAGATIKNGHSLTPVDLSASIM